MLWIIWQQEKQFPVQGEVQPGKAVFMGKAANLP